MADFQRNSAKPEAERRQDGGGETSPLPGSEAAHGSEQTENKGAGEGAAIETWTPGEGDPGVRPGSSAEEAVAGTDEAQG
jgi:hypothetical protein